VQAKVADGQTVDIIEETDYPFTDRVRITVKPKQPVSFPIYFRIPVWAEDDEVGVPGAAASRAQRGTLFKVERQWKPGDVVTLQFHFKVRAETRRRNNAVAIAWGPLWFSLRIGQAFVKLPGIPAKHHTELVPAPPGCVDWRIAPPTDWNCALAIDRENPQCTMVTNKVSKMPFARRGEPLKLAGAADFTPWPEDVPIVLKFRARHVPQWGMNGANAQPVPVSPMKKESPEEVVELIPYGCTRLRISESGELATVHQQHGAVHERGVPRSKEQRGAGDVVGKAEAAQRDCPVGGVKILADEGGLVKKRFAQAGPDEAGPDGVRSDAVWPELAGQRFDEQVETAL
jgi:uncharacterized protein